MNEKLDLYVGKRMRWRRRLLGMTQSDLAELIGVRYQQIQKYESAINRLSAARLWTLACALGVTVQYFYEGWVDQQNAPQKASLLLEQWAREQHGREQESHEQRRLEQQHLEQQAPLQQAVGA